MDLSPDAFLLQAAEEVFGHRIVITIAAPAHAALQVVLVKKPKMFIAAVLRPKGSEDVRDKLSQLAVHTGFIRDDEAEAVLVIG